MRIQLRVFHAALWPSSPTQGLTTLLAGIARMKHLFIAALLLSASARAQEVEPAALRGGIGFGVGTQYGVIGARAELGYGAFSGSIAVPVFLWDKSFKTYALAVRWSPRGKSGPFVSAGAMLAVDDNEFDQTTLVVFSLIGGWRWRLGPLSLEVGAGPAVSHLDYRFPKEDYGARNGSLVRSWSYGIRPDVTTQPGFPFDVSVGLGLNF